MKFICTQENLHKGLKVVSHIASRTTSLPILSNVIIEASDNVITITGTNLEIGIRTNVRGKVEKDGKVVVPAKLIEECISFLPKENVSIFTDGEALMVKGENSENKIHTISADDFPLLPKVEERLSFSLPLKHIDTILKSTLFSASYDETRPELSGIYIYSNNGKLIAAATDSYRLAEVEIEVDNLAEIPGVIVPLRTMQELARILPLLGETLEEKEAKIVLGEHQCVFLMDDAMVVSRLIDGQYPNYKEIIPSGSESFVVVHKEELEHALRAASLFSKTGMNDISLVFLPKEQGVLVSAANIHVGENITTVPAKVEGDGGEVVVNWRYLNDGLQSFSNESVKIEMTGEMSPLVLRPTDDGTRLYLIMPIRQ